MEMKSKRGRKAKRKAPLPLSKGDFVPECIVDKIDLRESCNQILYRVRWPNTWEKEENVQGCDALDCFLKNIEVTQSDLCETPTEDDEQLWEVHRIVQKKIAYRKVKYLVKWKDTWVWSEQLSNRPDLIRNFEDGMNLPHNSNANDPNVAEKPPKRKQSRLNDDNDENAVEIPIERNTKQRIATFSQSNTLKRLNKKQLQVIIDDDDIDTILEAVIYFDDERSFLFRRSNGEYGVIPIKVANIKYPDAVMEFYEKSLMKKL